MKVPYRTLTAFLFFMTLFSSAHAQKYWGAIYIDTNTGIAGGAYNARSNQEANREALASCQDKHKGRKNNCRYATSFYNNCGAIYWASNKAYGYGYQLNLSDAQLRALRECEKAGGKNCQHSLSFCTTRFY